MEIIDILKYILIGFIQGVSEVLPISSSAHLVIVSDVFGIKTPDSFEVFLHIASLIAVLVFLRKKLWQLIKGFFGFIFKRREEYKKDFMYCVYVVVSTLIVVIATVIFGNYSDKVANMLWLVGLLLVINAILLFVLTQIKGHRTRDDLNIKDALVIGAFQCLGVMPGISRSGSCLCGAFSRKIDKETCKVTDEVKYMTADEEDKYIICQASEELDENGCLKNKRVRVRDRAEIKEIEKEKVDYIVTYDAGFKMRGFLEMESNCFNNLHAFLNEVSTTCKFRKWFFGCFHLDRRIPPFYYAVYENIYDSETGKEI